MILFSFFFVIMYYRRRPKCLSRYHMSERIFILLDWTRHDFRRKAKWPCWLAKLSGI